MTKEDNSKYSRKEYWNERYEDEVEYDWLGNYDTIRSLILEYIPNKADKILMLGCGNSSLSVSMYHDGYKNIVNIDISEVCINRMKAAHKDTPMEWRVADATNLNEFETESFDIVIEKATIDAFLVTEKSPWSLSEDGERIVESCLSEVSRVLKPNSGKFLSFTFSPLHFRAPMFARPTYGWSVSHRTFGNENSFPYLCLIMVKGETLSDEMTKLIASHLCNPKLEMNDNYSESSSEEDFTSRIALLDSSDSDASPLPFDY